MISVQTWELRDGVSTLTEQQEVSSKAEAAKLIAKKRRELELARVATRDYGEAGGEDWPGFVARVNGVKRVVMLWIE